jgi:hypothetical protein
MSNQHSNTEPVMMKVLMYSYDRREHPDCPLEIPMSWFNEDWAQRIHSQSLARLNERGGLHPREMLTNINRVQFEKSPPLQECIDYLNNRLKSNH